MSSLLVQSHQCSPQAVAAARGSMRSSVGCFVPIVMRVAQVAAYSSTVRRCAREASRVTWRRATTIATINFCSTCTTDPGLSSFYSPACSPNRLFTLAKACRQALHVIVTHSTCSKVDQGDVPNLP